MTGDTGEFEILAYHYPVLGVLSKGEIIVYWNHKITINGGVVRFFANECVVIVQEQIETGQQAAG